MSITIVADAALAALARKARAAGEPLDGPGSPLSEAGQKLLGYLRADAPRKTGAYAAALTVATSASSIRASGPSPLTEYLTKGTRPHTIVPVRARALAWPGMAHPARVVHHPGTRPNDFARGAGERAANDLRAALAAYVARRVASA